jgi:hypothetical protein
VVGIRSAPRSPRLVPGSSRGATPAKPEPINLGIDLGSKSVRPENDRSIPIGGLES